MPRHSSCITRILRLPQTDPSTIKRAKNIRTKINTYLKTSNDREHAKETLYNSAISKILKKSQVCLLRYAT